MKKKFILVNLFLLFVFNNNAYAYLDPVTGSFIIQGLLAIIAAIIFYIRNPKKLYEDVKNLIKKVYYKIKKPKM